MLCMKDTSIRIHLPTLIYCKTSYRRGGAVTLDFFSQRFQSNLYGSVHYVAGQCCRLSNADSGRMGDPPLARALCTNNQDESVHMALHTA